MLIDASNDPNLVVEDDPADRGVGWEKEQVLVGAENIAEVGIDDAAVSHDDDVLATMRVSQAIDRPEAARPEFSSRLAERHEIPSALKPKPALTIEPFHFWK